MHKPMSKTKEFLDFDHTTRLKNESDDRVTLPFLLSQDDIDILSLKTP